MNSLEERLRGRERERDSDRIKDSQNEKVIIKQERGDKARKQLYFIKGNRKWKEREIDRQKEREREKEIDFVGGCVPEVLQKMTNWVRLSIKGWKINYWKLLTALHFQNHCCKDF